MVEMNAIESVFIEDTAWPVVKLERINDWPSGLDAAEPEKVGEIYRTTASQLAFVCANCGAEFPLFISFAAHIQQHFPEIRSGSSKFDDAVDERPIACNTSIDIDHSDSGGLLVKEELMVGIDNLKTNDGDVASAKKSTIDAAYCCSQCDVRFEKPSQFLNHEKTHWNSQGTHECPKCGKIISDYEKFKTHVRNHDRTTCQVCKEVLRCSSYNAHMAAHQSDNQRFCSPCNMEYSTASAYLKHIEEKHRGVAVAEKSKRVATADRLERADGLTADELSYDCSPCGIRFDKPSTFLAHEKIHWNVLGTHECPKCDKVFDDYEKFRTHVRNHDRTTCQLCKEAIRFASYSSHMAGHKYAEECFCLPCNMQFASRSAYQRHIEEEHPEEAPAATNECSDTVEISRPRSPSPEYHHNKQDEIELNAESAAADSNSCDANAALVRAAPVVPSGLTYDCRQCDVSFERPSAFLVHEKTHWDGHGQHKCPKCHSG